MTQENNWFETARLGMFVHWSHSSQCGYELSEAVGRRRL
jgi:alpha-L-fucosidase